MEYANTPPISIARSRARMGVLILDLHDQMRNTAQAGDKLGSDAFRTAVHLLLETQTDAEVKRIYELRPYSYMLKLVVESRG